MMHPHDRSIRLFSGEDMLSFFLQVLYNYIKMILIARPTA